MIFNMSQCSKRTISLFLLLVGLVSSHPHLEPRANSDPRKNGYDLFSSTDNVTGTFQQVDVKADPPTDFNNAFLVWTHNPEANGNTQVSVDSDANNLDPVVNTLLKWITAPNVELTMVPPGFPAPQCLANLTCNTSAECTPLYACLLTRAQYVGSSQGNRLTSCLQTRYPDFPTLATSQWQCGFNIKKAQPPAFTCKNNDQWVPKPDLYRSAMTDDRLHTAVVGGVDTSGYFWEGVRKVESFATAIGRQYLASPDLTCTLANPCTPDLDCNQLGSWTALSGGASGTPEPMAHAYMAMASIKNLNQQMHNQYSELKDAINNLALTTFNIDQFYPKKGQDFGLLNSLAGLSGFLSIVGGFVPVVGPAIAAGGAIAGGASSFISNSVASKLDALDAQKKFADKVSDIYNVLITGWDDATSRLFAGQTIGQGNRQFNITDMLKGGAWVDSGALTNVSDLNLKLRKEILSRSIDQLWKVFSSNKIWVLFTDLQDGTATAKCEAHTQGPQASKYCADGGVYYTYNFIEKGDEAGGLGYPWGAAKLGDVGLSFKDVTQASVRSYRLSKAMGKDPFAFDYNEGTATFIQQSLEKATTDAPIDLSTEAGRFAGSWTIPVCDGGTWGASWQVDYASSGQEYVGDSHAPCLCGPQGSETNAWAKAAGMSSFKTFWHRCTRALEDKRFQWPDGVTSVSYPVSDGGREYQVKKPGT